MNLYTLRTCDTCRKALAQLRAAGHDPTVTDIRADGLTPAQIDAIVAAFGDDAVNRRSATWRNLSDDDRALPPGDLIAAHPTVMKRPVIEVDGVWYLGWDADVRAALAVPG